MADQQYWTPAELSAHLDGNITVKTLANWRCDPVGRGPRFRRIGNKILYPISGVLEWEQAQEVGKTSDYGKKAPAALAA